MHNNCKYESEKIVEKIHNLIYMLRTLTLSRVTIINFQKVGQQGLKNEDEVGQKFI